MALSEEQKRKIEEEEDYRAEIREESQKTSKKGRGGCSGCFVVLIVFVVLFAITLIAINPQKQIEQAEKARISAIKPVYALNIVGKSEDEIKTTYASIYTNYADTGLTPSARVKITGFDIPSVNIQIDYEVETNKPVYIGYSFSANPVEEATAWSITGVSKPTVEAASNPGIMNRTVYVWENLPEIEPYKMLQAIYEADGKVGKIAFGMEDLATAKSNNSLYYVQDR